MRGTACCGDAPRGVSALLALCRRQGGSSPSSGAPPSIGASPELLELSVRDMSCVLLEPCDALSQVVRQLLLRCSGADVRAQRVNSGCEVLGQRGNGARRGTRRELDRCEPQKPGGTSVQTCTWGKVGT